MDKSETPIRIPLAGTPAEEIFTRQLDDYSCGPACLATVGNIYATGKDYTFYRNQAKPDPNDGTPEGRMTDLAKKLLPFEGSGLDTYKGGVAIAHIIQDEGHYVVFLKQEGDRVLYYDPYEHELVIDKLSNVAWQSDHGDRDHWAMDFTPLPDNSIARWVDMALPKPLPPQFRAPPGPRP